MPSSTIGRLTKRASALGVLLFLLCAAPACAIDVNDLFERAKNLYDVKDYRGALSLYDAVLSSDPRNAEALDFSGWCCRYMGDLSSAEKRFNDALGVLDGEPSKWVHVGLGEAYLQAGLYEKALASFEKARGVASGDSEVILRALKGSVLSCIPTNTKKARGFILEIERIAPEEAQSLSLDIAAMEKKRTPEVAAAPEAQAPTDVSERQGALLQETPAPSEAISSDVPSGKTKPADAPKPEKKSGKKNRAPKKAASSAPVPSAAPSQQAARNVIPVFGIALGETENKVVADMKQLGLGVGKSPAFVKENQRWFVVEGRNGFDSDALFLQRAVHVRTFVVSFRDRIMSVVRTYDYPKGSGPLEEFADLELKGKDFLSGRGRLSQVLHSVTVTEMGTIVSREYAVWLHVRNNLDGSCSVEVQHMYLPLFSDYLSDCGRNGA